MGPSIDRRSILKIGGSLMTAAAFGTDRALAQSEVRLRMVSVGNQGSRRSDRRCKQDLHRQEQEYRDRRREFSGWSDYWSKLATQVAGRNAPDVIQMDYRYMFEYARRGALLDLNPYMGKALQIDDFGKDATDAGRVDGKLNGVSLGMNSMCTIFNRTVLDSIGTKPPTLETSWADYAVLASEITKKANKPGFFGSGDGKRLHRRVRSLCSSARKRSVHRRRQTRIRR